MNRELVQGFRDRLPAAWNSLDAHAVGVAMAGYFQDDGNNGLGQATNGADFSAQRGPLSWESITGGSDAAGGQLARHKIPVDMA